MIKWRVITGEGVKPHRTYQEFTDEAEARAFQRGRPLMRVDVVWRVKHYNPLYPVGPRVEVTLETDDYMTAIGAARAGRGITRGVVTDKSYRIQPVETITVVT